MNQSRNLLLVAGVCHSPPSAGAGSADSLICSTVILLPFHLQEPMSCEFSVDSFAWLQRYVFGDLEAMVAGCFDAPGNRFLFTFLDDGNSGSFCDPFIIIIGTTALGGSGSFKIGTL